jgi:hypothetical protein
MSADYRGRKTLLPSTNCLPATSQRLLHEMHEVRRAKLAKRHEGLGTGVDCFMENLLR